MSVLNGGPQVLTLFVKPSLVTIKSKTLCSICMYAYAHTGVCVCVCTCMCVISNG